MSETPRRAAPPGTTPSDLTDTETAPATAPSGRYFSDSALGEPADPLIDWQRVTELRDEIGAEDFDEVVALFLTEVQATLDRLPRPPCDLSALSEQLHFLKGSTLNLGFARLSTLCRAGELAITAGLGATLDPDTLRRCYARSREEFIAQLPELRAA